MPRPSLGTGIDTGTLTSRIRSISSSATRRLLGHNPHIRSSSSSRDNESHIDGDSSDRYSWDNRSDRPGSVGSGRLGLIGLENLGNTCYMNCALQCLIATQKLTDFFLSGLFSKDLNKVNPLGTSGRLAIEFASLAAKLWSYDNSAVSPTGIKRLMDSFAPQFSGYGQQDAQEFTSFLLDGLHEDLNRVTKKPFVEEPDINRSTLRKKKEEHLAAEAWYRHLLRNRSYLVDIFQGQLKSLIKCKQCDEVSVKFEPFMYLSLPMTDQNGKLVSSLDEALKAFETAEELSGENRWYCPNCKQFVCARKNMMLWKVPPVLIIHLKKFQHSDGEFIKIDCFIDVPIGRTVPNVFGTSNNCIDIGPYVQQKQKDEPHYHPYAVIDHSGRAQFGHYTAKCWHRFSESWFLFDDAVVTPIEPSEVITADVYVLFLKRKDISDDDKELMRRQTLAHPEDWPHILRTSSINEILGRSG